MTLHDFPKNQPYRVLLLLFENYDRKKWNLPHIGQWRHLASLDSFVHDALEDFHLKTDPELLAEYLFTSLRQNLLVVPDITVDRRAELAREIFVVRDKLEHLDEDINWQEFSLVRAGYSPVYLRTFFKEQFNIPPYQYRLRYRIRTACKLLVESTLSIREISEKTRFRNLETFYRAFKKQHNSRAIPPEEFFPSVKPPPGTAGPIAENELTFFNILKDTYLFLSI